MGKRKVRREKPFALPDGTDTEAAYGLFTGVRFFRTEILTDWPTRDSSESRDCDESESPELENIVFEDLRDWLIPGIESRGLRVQGELIGKESSTWEPVGTPTEYLHVNLTPPVLPTLGGAVEHWSGEVDVRGPNHSVIISGRASVDSGAKLNRCVVWDGEEVPAGFVGESGIYAGGGFVHCPEAIS